MRKMKLSDITISAEFAKTIPSERKMQQCRDNWNKWKRQDRYLVVSPDSNILIDGYIQYLVLKENGIEEAEVKIYTKRKKRWFRKNVSDWSAPHYKNEETTYVYGVHPNSKCTKEFVWRVPKSWIKFAENVQVGDLILCNTKFGRSPVIVTRIEVLDKSPFDFYVKRVASEEIKRNGTVLNL